MWQLALTFFAGLLTALSPCVLPALPLVVGSAAQAHRLGPAALASGMIAAFTAVGLVLTAFGQFLGLDEESVRWAAGAVLVASGVMLMSRRMGEVLSKAFSPIAATANRILGSALSTGLLGQFAVGSLLGAIWSPCVGPALGAAIGLAAEGHDLGRAGISLAVYGLGASVPLLALAYGFRNGILRHRERLARYATHSKVALGLVLAVTGAAVLTGADKSLESALLLVLPQGWVDWTARF